MQSWTLSGDFRAFLQNGWRGVRGRWAPRGPGGTGVLAPPGTIGIIGRWNLILGVDGAPGQMSWLCHRFWSHTGQGAIYAALSSSQPLGSVCSSHSEKVLPKSPRTISLALLLPKGLLASHPSGSDSNSVSLSHVSAASLLSSPGHSLSKHKPRALQAPPCISEPPS